MKRFTEIREIGVCWQESLKILMNKQFWLVTLKAAKETYTFLVTKLWWLMLLFAAFGWLMPFAYNLTHALFLGSYEEDLLIPWVLIKEIILIVLWLTLVFSLFLIVRPSLNKKDLHYFLSKKKWFLYFIISIFALIIGILILSFYPATVSVVQSSFLFLLFFSPFLILWVLFFLDSQPRLFNLGRCLVRSCKLIIYSLPFFLVVGLILNIMMLLVFKIPAYAVSVLLPFFFCIINNFYIKAVHDHYDLFK